ncbi:hypothetical protein SAMD00019534_069650 [Acytostelium subglobosum LB1]|uniref:hypothetical protein n=1 Tax=Acytostelium subglobosum LB1 TaxID=1410327 RepID=UPI00064502F9|nr:hypothetical protein SAMD00019534_069650 [Acytostelium subglobosum LB1]GAM23790.1 hypothetical protein SAMD00019534_069650 [Acytostelium subglobosum LB1]|eukprot:XP_012753531.1 hypothetical protein SAMD00019534_069650 [Acytostelium subglobosum LB1]
MYNRTLDRVAKEFVVHLVDTKTLPQEKISFGIPNTLEYFYLDSLYLDISFFNTLERNHSLKHLHLTYGCLMDSTSTKALRKMLCVNHTITSLSLRGNMLFTNDHVVEEVVLLLGGLQAPLTNLDIAANGAKNLERIFNALLTSDVIENLVIDCRMENDAGHYTSRSNILVSIEIVDEDLQ